VGERGPELVNLPRGSQVVPAAQTSNMMGGVGGAVEIYGILRGQDIYFSNKKYSATYARTT
jgi:phage-related tail protein